jgi:hypothetical protein
MNVTKSSFVPQGHQAFREQNDLIGHLLELGAGGNVGSQVEQITEANRQALRDQGYRYLLIDKASIVRPRIGGQEGVEWVSDWSRLERRLRPVVGTAEAQDEAFALYTLDEARLECGP